MINKIKAWILKVLREEGEAQTKIVCAALSTAEAKYTRTIKCFDTDFARLEDIFEAHLRGIEDRMTQQLEDLVDRTLERFDQKAQLIESTISKELDHWKADEDTRKQDEALRRKK